MSHRGIQIAPCKQGTVIHLTFNAVLCDWDFSEERISHIISRVRSISIIKVTNLYAYELIRTLFIVFCTIAHCRYSNKFAFWYQCNDFYHKRNEIWLINALSRKLIITQFLHLFIACFSEWHQTPGWARCPTKTSSLLSHGNCLPAGTSWLAARRRQITKTRLSSPHSE